MNRYKKTFENLKAKKQMALVPFWMIGAPSPEKSLEIIRILAQRSDILELGIPFSDPLADGPVLQASSNRAIKSGMTTRKAFEIMAQIRAEFPEKPMGVLVYLNLIIAFGVSKFFEAAKKAGVDSLLIPELPIESVSDSIEGGNISFQQLSEKFDLPLVYLISTNTPEKRVEKILKNMKGGFLYAISTPSVTGEKSEISPETFTMIKNLKKKTEVPVCVGFGISSPEQLGQLKKNQADGGIIGSKLISMMDDLDLMKVFCDKAKKACCHGNADK